MHPNVANDGEAQSIKHVSLCVAPLPGATGATWLHDEQHKVAGLCHCVNYLFCFRQEMMLLETWTLSIHVKVLEQV